MVVPMLISAFATVAYGAEITYVDDTGKKYTLTDFRDTQGHWAQAQIKIWATSFGGSSFFLKQVDFLKTRAYNVGKKGGGGGCRGVFL